MSKKILLVDDEPSCTFFLGTFLQEEGYDVQTSGTGIGAIEIGKSFNPDILVTDWMLKDEKNGLDVAEELLKLNPNLGIIFITGMAADALEGKLGNIPTYKILEKPLDLDQIAQFIRSCE